MLYDAWMLAIRSNDCPEEFQNSRQYQFIEDKLKEIEISLKYADLESFAKHMISKRPKQTSSYVSLTFRTCLLGK